MRVVNLEQLKRILGSLPENPRVVASGNFATPHVLLNALDEVVPEYRLHMLNAQKGLPDREGVTYETAFVGPGMRNHERLVYIPCRLSLVPVLFRDHYRPDVVLLHASGPRHDTVSLGTEVNILPAAIESARERGGLVIVQSNPHSHRAEAFRSLRTNLQFLNIADRPKDMVVAVHLCRGNFKSTWVPCSAIRSPGMSAWPPDT